VVASDAGTTTIAGRVVPRLGFGTMRLTGPGIFGPPADREEAIRVVRRAYELGVRVIDTAWYYGPYVANEIVADALRPYPDDLLLVAKLGGGRGEDASWHGALRPDQLRAGCEHDLRTLGVEQVPVVHLRWIPTPGAGFEDALGTMLELQAEGKIGAIGLSTVDLAQYRLASSHTPVATVSNAYSLMDRTHDDLVARCEADGVAFLPYFPLGASPASHDIGVDKLAAVKAVGERLGATPIQVALAWLLARSPIMVPIPGTSSVSHLEENVGAADLTLGGEELAQLDTA
jgi:aryl-alcohol dehydrogenase-like predicted oxidoreductase